MLSAACVVTCYFGTKNCFRTSSRGVNCSFASCAARAFACAMIAHAQYTRSPLLPRYKIKKGMNIFTVTCVRCNIPKEFQGVADCFWFGLVVATIISDSLPHPLIGNFTNQSEHTSTLTIADRLWHNKYEERLTKALKTNHP